MQKLTLCKEIAATVIVSVVLFSPI